MAAQIRAGGGSADAVALDVTSDASMAGAFAALPRPVDVLVNDAGLQHVAPLEEFQMTQVGLPDPGDAGRVGAADARRVARACARAASAASSTSAASIPWSPARTRARTSPPNTACSGLTQTIALETAGADITINTICPSYVKTPLVDKQIADQARTRGIPEADVIKEIMLKPMPKGVFIGIDELAGITAFLMSPAARNITGQAIVVDGGWTAQ